MLGRRGGEEPRAAVEIAGGVAASIGQVFRSFVNPRAGSAGSLIVTIDVVEIDKHALSRNVGVADALHPVFGVSFTHHD